MAALLRFMLLVVLVTLAAAATKKGKLYKPSPKQHKNPWIRAVACGSGQWACPERCIDAAWHCDGEDDCLGGTDEDGCSTDCSDPNKFACTNGNCVPTYYQCDGDNDCLDFSDELHCSNSRTCHSYQFQCGSGQCIAGSWKCDGDLDCADGSDETSCATRTCNSREFTCANGLCVPIDYKCDGDNDCSDHSDENNCTCTSSQFHCDHGGCVPQSYVCDGDNDCSDYSDERCPDIPAAQCADKMSLTDCAHMNTTTFPICLQHADAFKHCRKFCHLCEDFGNKTRTIV